jgi:HD-GYP domain-containing protein (c-di-GMP phosphodiesterase class II)
VRHGNSQYGWLIALNRIPWKLRSDRPAQAVPATCSDDEFGTGDASLIGSAAAALGAHARNVDLLRQKEHMLIGTIRTLVNALDAKDSYTCGHSERVALYAKSIAQQLGLSGQAAERIYVAGLLHDIGKIGVPDQVLLKPDRLSEHEFSVVQQHPVIGHNILKHIPQLERVLPGVLHHHESFDGHGYPHRLRGEAIPLDGRILAVADAYDAMTSARPYRAGMPAERAEEILRKGSGIQWDATVVDAFFEAKPRIEQCIATPEKFDQNNLETSDSPGRTWHDVEIEAGLQEAGEHR